MKKIIATLLTLALCITCIPTFSACGKKSDNKSVLIYTSAEDYRIADLQQRLDEQFPDYDITIEYMSTGDHAAKLISEGTKTDCDITYDLEYSYIQQLAAKEYLADLSDICDFSIYTQDIVNSKYYIPECRVGGAIIINPEMLAEKNLPEPTSYQDLLDPMYKGLISMANPKSSGTGYMFLRYLVNEWGEDTAFEYFDKLTENILQYTSSGSGPVNALLQKEAAIGLGMTGQAVTKINTDNANLKVIFFEEGSPFNMYGQGIIKGKEERQCVVEVFDFMANTYNYEACEKFFPEKIFIDKDFTIENYPTNIIYGDMSNNTAPEKERLLSKWNH